MQFTVTGITATLYTTYIVRQVIRAVLITKAIDFTVMFCTVTKY